MTPITFGKCFGWLHYAPGVRGVVMCSPFGFEELGTHRGWVELADKIAASGRPTLRFDYEGINDSLGTEDDPNRIEAWVQSIIDAVDYLKNVCGIKEVALVGLRLGGLLASLAAEKLGDVDQLVLFAPVVSGRSYVRELRLAAESWWTAASPSSHKETSVQYLDVIGDRLFKQTLDHLSGLKIDNVSAKKVLLLDQGHRQDVTKYFEKMVAVGAKISKHEIKDLDLFLRDAVQTVHPTSIFDVICDWLGDGGTKSCVVPNSLGMTQAALQTEVFTDEPIRFGPENKLFGFLTKPALLSKQYPSVIILNTGPNHHVGNGRLSVTLARRLAFFGIATLRFDLAGIGDSDRIQERKSSLYSEEAKDDVKKAIEVMEALHSNGCVIVGLCSGAFLAFHSALASKSVVGAVIVNLQKFIWVEGTSLSIGNRKVKRSTKFYMKAARRGGSWMRILKGEVDPFNLAKVLTIRIVKQCYTKLVVTTGLFAIVSEPKAKVFNWAKELSDRNVKTRLWYSDDDPGLVELEEYLGKFGRKMINLPNISVDVLGGADHSLNSHAARLQFIAMFEKFMHESFTS
jgi:pimeloyl-ACP methyl ester carboxylesterase